MGTAALLTSKRIVNIPIVQISINKQQLRKSLDTAQLRSLSESIAQNEILQPLIVRMVECGEYELICGERRLRAAVLAGLNSVPCVVVSCTQEQGAVIALVENLQRENLNFFEQANEIRLLMSNFSLTQQETANKIGRRQSFVADKLGLLKLTDEEQLYIIKKNLTEGHARAILKIDNEILRKKLLRKITENGLNVWQTEKVAEKLISDSIETNNPLCSPKIIIKDIRLLFNTINHAVQTFRKSGINVTEEKTETTDYIDYHIRIPK